MEYTIIKSNRKTISIQITQKGEVIVRAPKYASEHKISTFVVEHQSWIYKRLDDYATLYAETPRHTYREGDRFYFLGKQYPVMTSQNQKMDIVFSDAFHIKNNCKNPRKSLLKWYKSHALDYCEERMKEIGETMNIKHRCISVTSAEKRWGSCTSDKHIHVSYKIIMLSPEYIDYILIHELAHCRHMNHSPKFWKLVEKYCPDFKKKRRWLRSHQHLFTL